jgi:Ca2+-transporting ATPase
LGLVGFLDPPREDVKPAISTCHEAGIKVVMITGDHPETARNIAEAVGVMDDQAATLPGDRVIRGDEIVGKSEAQLLNVSVFARVTPAQKLDLVSLYQKNGYVVGMTGDGVNDAPALKKADIGIAMGIRGTEAAKEVADVILRDDQFSSIELAVRQGRIIFENIRKFVVFLLSSNLAEIISVAIAALVSLPLPLLPIQILYLNLITDVFPALSLATCEGEQDIMKKKPRPSEEPIMPGELWGSYFCVWPGYYRRCSRGKYLCSFIS